VVERADRAPVGTFYAPADGAWGAHVELGEAAAHHAAVKRLATGDVVRITSGEGSRALGTIADMSRRALTIALEPDSLETAPRPLHLELWAPVGDRERMLLLAEKAVELGASAWRPIVYRRSRSVNPRGEGDAFREKVKLRMISALEQSGSPWLPMAYEETTLDAALARTSNVRGVLLDVGGVPVQSLDRSLVAPMALALGPEGGLEPAERAAFDAAGWRVASLGGNVLRFETAGIAALALVRAYIR
jgi:16S rRNA (uracil1498-N3)-methyltransferase